MSDKNGSRLVPLGGKHFCTRQEAEEIAHASYVLATKDAATRNVALVKAFEARIAGLEERIAALEPQPTGAEFGAMLDAEREGLGLCSLLAGHAGAHQFTRIYDREHACMARADATVSPG